MSKSFLRKIAAFVALITAAVSISSCSKNKSETDDRSDMPNLVIGCDYYAPFVSSDENGNFIGLDVEIAKEVCKHIGYNPVFKRIKWTQKKLMLEKKEIDCVWGCFPITGRAEEYYCSTPYLKSKQVVAVPSDSDIKRISDLENKVLGVQAASKMEDFFTESADALIPSLKNLLCFGDTDGVFAAMRIGYVDAIAGHEAAILEYMKTSSITMRILDEGIVEVELGVAFEKGADEELVNKINDTLALLSKNGFTSRLLTKYGLDPDYYLAVER